MKRVFFLLVLVTLGSSEVSLGGGGGVVGMTGEKPSTENYQTYHQSYLAPTGYYQYNNNNNNNGYNNPGYNAYYPQNHQKQDLFNFGGGGGGNNGGGFGGGNDLFNTDSFDPSSISGSLGAILAALGLKGITKLGIAVALLFFFVILPLLILPLALAIAAIAVAASQMSGSGSGNNNKDSSWLDNFKQMMGKNDDNSGQRAMATFYKFMNNEECIEKISCAISQRAYSRSFNLHNHGPKTVKSENGTVADSPMNNKNKSDSARTKSKGTFMSRIARAMKADDCQVYSCSVMTYLS